MNLNNEPTGGASGNNEPQKKWLDSQDVLIMMMIKPRTLRHWRQHNYLPYHRLGGGRSKIFFNYDEIETALKEGKIWKGRKKKK